jgi:hypothetical protein
MSLCLACVVVSTFDQSDWLKLLGIAGAMVALYVAAKRLGGGDEAIPPPSGIQVPIEPEAPTMEVPEGGYPEVEDPGKVDYEPEVKADPEKPQPRNIRIINWNFEHFDTSTGCRPIPTALQMTFGWSFIIRLQGTPGNRFASWQLPLAWRRCCARRS